MEKYLNTYIKKGLFILVILVSYMGFSQDKVVSITISQPSVALSVSGTATPATGFGLSTGSVNITPNGGTAGYTYAWNNGATSQDLVNITAGSYTVTVTDANGCTTSGNYTVTQPSLLTSSITVLNTLDCFGDSNGSLRANGSGGVTGYTYVWTRNGSAYANTRTISNLNAANYSVTVTDANGNTSISSYNLTQPGQVQSTIISTTNINCFGDSTGAINISASGGTPGYTYLWTKVGDAGFNETTQDLNNIPSGQYNIRITDSNGCILNSSTPITISEPANPISITSPTNGIQNPSANGATDGSININVTGGTGSYAYSWTNGATTQDISGLGDGSYTVTVTDTNGCSDSETFTLSEPPPFVVNISLAQSILCNGNSTGSLRANPSGGVPNPGPSYDYAWFDTTSGTPVSIGITTQVASSLGAATYRVVATDNNGNTTSDDFLLGQPAAVNLSMTSTNVSCLDGNTGSANVSVNGGTGGYIYTWTKTGDGTFSANTAAISNLTAGEYNVLVTDGNNCSENASVIITQPGSGVSIALNSITDVTIAGQNTGAIDISISGGPPGYTYEWTRTGDAGFNEITQDLTTLFAGEYTILVTDANGCTTSETYTVSEPPPLSVTVTKTGDILCFGESNGELTANPSGGVSGYTYNWTKTGAGSFSESTAIIANLDAGEYIVLVTDSNGATITENYVLTEPLTLTASTTSVTDILCFGESTGLIDIGVTGGTGSYYYEWFDANGSLSVFTQNLSNVPSGNYTVIVSDDNGCETTLGPITLIQPATAMTITDVAVTDLLGFQTGDGSISITVEGGTLNYTYEWRVAGTTGVIGNASTINNLQAGDYELTLIDANECTIVEVYTVTEPPLLEITSINETSSILCFGDTTAELVGSVTGGFGAYQYSWHNSLDATTILSTEVTLSGIGVGNYVLEVIDFNGITTSLDYNVIQPDELIATFAQTNVSCNGGTDGSIDVSVTGGTGAYSFFWSNGANTEDISGLAAGNYSVTVRDQNFCETIVNVSITEPVEVLAIPNSTVVNATGNGLTNGSVTINVSGGTTPYTYVWTDATNTILGSTTNELLNVGAGNYYITITDANGCLLGPIEYIVTEPEVLALNIAETAISCYGETGELIAGASGGDLSYNFEWFDASNTSISSVASTGAILTGVYTVVVTDGNNNQDTQTVTLSEPNELLIDSVLTSDVNCYGGLDGIIEINVTGGTGNYIYTWSNSGSSTNQLTEISAGDYSVTITDDNNCTVSSGTITITEPALYDVTSVDLVRPSAPNTSDGSISIDIIGGISPYDYIWTDGSGTTLQSEINVTSNSSAINGLQEDSYTITIIDADGCSLIETYSLATPGELLVSIQQTREISCFGGSDAILYVETIGGAGGNDYVWYNLLSNAIVGGNSDTLSGVSEGSYYVVVSNAEGVSEQSPVFVVSEPAAVQVSSTSTNPSCYSLSDGSIFLTATGGSSSYEYRQRIEGSAYSNWVPFTNPSTTTIVGLNDNSYEIQVRDSNACFYEDLGTIGVIPITLVEPLELVITDAQVVEPSGFGLTNGSVEVTAQGGTMAYSYQWSDVNGMLTETSNTLSSIGMGTYTVLVIDANGCQVQENYTLSQPDALLTTVSQVNIILCNGNATGSLRANPSGGVIPYAFEWFASGNASSVLGTNQTIENLGPGTYFAIVTDVNGNRVQSQNFTITEPDQLVVSVTSDFVLCGDGNDWDIFSQVLGGTAPYSYVWNNSGVSENLDNVLPGNYSVTVTDANGCIATSNIDLVPPPVITAVETIVNPTCFEGGDAEIVIDVSGGTTPYTYLWSTGETTNSIIGLTAGSYEVTITDSKGCELVQNYVVTNPAELIVDLGEDVTLCVDQSYILDATINNGVSYQWTSDIGFTSNEAIIEVTEAGIYTVVSTNNQGCLATDEFILTQSSAIISADFVVSTQVFTDESFVMVDVSEPIPDEVIWAFPEVAEVIEENGTYAEILISTPGEYEITMFTRVGNCMEYQTKTVLVLVPEALEGEESNSSPMIMEYTIHPNPSDGNFNINTVLREIQPVSFKIFGLVNNAIIDHRTYEGAATYDSSYNLNLPTGVYFVLLETPYARQLRKIIIE